MTNAQFIIVDTQMPPPPKDNATVSTTQEEDLLLRSTKKSKLHDTSTLEPKLPQENSKQSSPISYKDVLNTIFGADSDEEDWGGVDESEFPENKWYQDDKNEGSSEYKPFNHTPEIPLSDDEISRGSKPWENTLIVKVLGKRVNFKLLDARLRNLWQIKGLMKVTDMAQDFYLVQLTKQEDYHHTLFEGPWKIVDHYLIVQR